MVELQQSIEIQGTDVPLITYQDQRVVTLAMVDTLHQRPSGTARKRFNDNRQHLIPEEDYFETDQASEIRTLGISRPQGGTPEKIILLTETGYLMVVKSFKDDLAWAVQRMLVSGYFSQRRQAAAMEQELAELQANLEHCHLHLLLTNPKWARIEALSRVGSSEYMMAKYCKWTQLEVAEAQQMMRQCGFPLTSDMPQTLADRERNARSAAIVAAGLQSELFARES